MVHVLILLDTAVGSREATTLPLHPIDRMVEALSRAIAANPTLNATIHEVDSAHLDAKLEQLQSLRDGLILCPLTLNIPHLLGFPYRGLYETCRDIKGLQIRVKQQFGVEPGQGEFWLPVVLMAKGPLYGEVIGQRAPEVTATVIPVQNEQARSIASRQYYQPLHLPDRWRQPLYSLGGNLLRSLAAPPATYLMQFGFQTDRLCFDRLFPFPAAPAIASIGTQDPDLFTCHWRCLTGQPIHDLVITSDLYQVYEPSQTL